MSASIPCKACGGDIEYETESVDSGDGPWAQSGIVGLVLWECLPEQNARTSCGCYWTDEEIEKLDEAATKAAGEYSEP